MDVLTSLNWKQMLLILLILFVLMIVRNVTGMFFPKLAKWIPPGGITA